jgi:hypothetical protein
MLRRNSLLMTTNERYDTEYKHVVRRRCYDALEEAGFTRFRKEGVDWPFGNGFHCWVGLNTALDHDCVEINPFVGVHVVPIEKLTAIKCGKYAKEYNRGLATYSIHIGELAPKECAFRFSRQLDIDSEAARLARLYLNVGLPFAASMKSYELLLPLLVNRISQLGGYPESAAACMYLMGRAEESRAFVEEFVKQEPDYFEGFAVPFLKMLAR